MSTPPSPPLSSTSRRRAPGPARSAKPQSPILLLLLAPLIPACTIISRAPRIPTHYYTLVPPPPPASPTAPTLAIASLAAPGRYREAIFYRTGTHEVGHHEYDRWVESPAELATRALSRALQAANVARVVAPESLLRHADLVLVGRLERFDQVREGKTAAAECALHLILKDSRTRQILFARRFEARRPAAKPDVPAFVAAMEQALAKTVAAAAVATADAIASHKPNPGDGTAPPRAAGQKTRKPVASPPPER